MGGLTAAMAGQVNKSYPLLGTKVEESGEHLIVGACLYIVYAPYITCTLRTSTGSRRRLDACCDERRDASEGEL
jgi:hypothetical protein